MKENINIEVKPKLGEGIFLTTDIAQILNLKYPKVKRWLDEYWLNYTFGDEGNKAVNFNTLIEFYTFYKLREKKLTVQSIRKYHSIISSDLDTPYPFAHSRISTDGNNVWYDQLGNLIKADGKKQFDLKPIIQPFLDKIDFGGTETAKRFYPLFPYKGIVIDPQRQFGQPIINGTSIRAETLYNLYKGGEKKPFIAELYNLKTNQVTRAIEYFKKAA